jgi:hypothetical protein
VRCRRFWNHHCRLNWSWDVAKESNDRHIVVAFRRRFVLRCYRRLITTSRMQWSHCHSWWRSGRLSFCHGASIWCCNWCCK